MTTFQIIIVLYACFNCFMAGNAWADSRDRKDLLLVGLSLFFGFILFAAANIYDYSRMLIKWIDDCTYVSFYWLYYRTDTYSNWDIDRLRKTNLSAKYLLQDKESKKSAGYKRRFSKAISMINERNNYDFSKDKDCNPASYGYPFLDETTNS